MRSTNSLGNWLAAVALTFAAASGATPCVAAQPNQIPTVDQIEADLHRFDRIPLGDAARAKWQRDEGDAIIERLRRAPHHELLQALIAAVGQAKTNRDVVMYRSLLPNLPSIKADILQHIPMEQNATVKGRLVICLLHLPGTDVVQTLIAALDDKRPVDPHEGSSALRVCDYAFNNLYDRVLRIPEVDLDRSTAKSDSIARDVPIDWREARIGKLEKGLIAKFGPDLRLPEGL